jgi:hypothetical protein
MEGDATSYAMRVSCTVLCFGALLFARAVYLFDLMLLLACSFAGRASETTSSEGRQSGQALSRAKNERSFSVPGRGGHTGPFWARARGEEDVR